MKRLLSALLPVIVVAAGVAALVWMTLSRPRVETRPPERLIPLVRVIETTRRDFRFRVTSQGTVAPRLSGTLVPRVAGEVVWTSDSWAGGGFFDKGEPLIRIDRSDYELARANALSQLAQAKLRLAQEEEESAAALEEWQSLGKKVGNGEEPPPLLLRKPQLEQVRAAVAAAQAGVDRAELDLERTELTAPYSGRIRDVVADFGDYVRPGAILAHLYATDYVEIRLPIPDRDLPFVDLPLAYRDGSTTALSSPEVALTTVFAGERRGPWRGSIVRTDGEISTRSRMVHAIARVEDPYRRREGSLPPLAVGLFVEAEIEGREARNVALLPRHALRGGDRVLIVAPLALGEGKKQVGDAGTDENGGVSRLVFREVHVLRRQGDDVVIDLETSAIAAGDRVCISPLELEDEMSVRVMTESSR